VAEAGERERAEADGVEGPENDGVEAPRTTAWKAPRTTAWKAPRRRRRVVTRRSPLVLWPVELVREPGGGLRLVEATGVESRCNQTLREKLRRGAGPGVPDGEAAASGAATNDDAAAHGELDGEIDLEGLLAAVEALVADRPGWSVERSAALGIFGSPSS